MKQMQWRVIVGLLLVVAGVMLLFQTFNILSFVWDVVWAVLFVGGGICFLVIFLGDRDKWWAAIPGMALLGIGGIIGLSIVRLDGILGGPLFLAAASAGFWLVYLRVRENWWAVIPGGVLLTLALITGLEEIAPRLETGGLFLLGLALTFALLYLLPRPDGRMTWALIPAGVLFVIGLAVTIATTNALGFFWAAALIVGGGYLVYRAIRA